MTRDELLALAREPEIWAFLQVIRACEGTAGDEHYNTLFGYRKFQGWEDHPRQKISANGYVSTAAGAYQILEKTWDEIRKKHQLPDFSPASQDAAAVGLLIRRKAIDAIRNRKLAEAITLTNREWASLPDSPYGQPTRSMAFVEKVFLNALGTTASVKDKGKPMTHIGIALAGELVRQLLAQAPELIKIFKDKEKPVDERNLEAAKKVLEIAQTSTAAQGPATAVETLAKDPVALRNFREEIKPMLELAEVGGGIQAARGFHLHSMTSGGWPAASYGILIFLVAMGVVLGGGALMGKMLFMAEVKPEVVSQILDYYKAAGFIVLGYLFGTSRSSQRKDDILFGKEGK